MATPELRCAQCGAANNIPPTGIMMTCPYCDFTQEVPDPDGSRRRAHNEAERRKQQAAQKQADIEKRRQRDKAETKGRAVRGLIALGVLIPLIIAGVVMYNNGVFDDLLDDGPGYRGGGGRYGGGGPTGRPGLANGPTGETQYKAVARKLKAQGYTLTGTMDVVGAQPNAHIMLSLARGSCYALAVGTPQQIHAVLIDTKPRVVEQPNGKKNLIVRVCPDRTSTYRATVRLKAPGNVAWGLFWRSHKSTHRRHRISPRQHHARRVRRARRGRRVARGSEPPPQNTGARNASAEPDDDRGGSAGAGAPPPSAPKKRARPKDDLPDTPSL